MPVFVDAVSKVGTVISWAMPRPVLATIHTASLRENLARCRQCAPDAKVWAVVKANAYGHGIERVFEALRGADGFALLDLDEAQRVRDLGWRGPILLLEGVFEPRDLELCSRLGLWHTVHNDDQIDMLAMHKTHVPHRVFLKMNSGMNRLGFKPAVYRGAWSRLDALPQVQEITLMTHFAGADGPAGVAAQMAVFLQATQDLPGERSVGNSAATLRHMAVSPAGHGVAAASDWIRSGIATYGSAPDYPQHDAAHWGLRAAMTLSARIIAVTGTPVLLDGVRSRTVGRVSMDMLTVDLAPVPQAGIGSEVVLWGQSGNAVLSIDAVAQAAGTIGYELMCALAQRVPVLVD